MPVTSKMARAGGGVVNVVNVIAFAIEFTIVFAIAFDFVVAVVFDIAFAICYSI